MSSVERRTARREAWRAFQPGDPRDEDGRLARALDAYEQTLVRHGFRIAQAGGGLA